MRLRYDALAAGANLARCAMRTSSRIGGMAMKVLCHASIEKSRGSKDTFRECSIPGGVDEFTPEEVKATRFYVDSPYITSE